MASLAGKAAAMIAGAAVLGAVGAGVYSIMPNASADEKVAGDKAAAVTSIPQTPEKPPPTALLDQPPAEPSAPATSAPSAVVTKAPAAPVAVKPGTPAEVCRGTGPGQLAVEKYLATHTEFGPVTVDGKQSAQDCAAIKKFQARYGVLPLAGYAGPVSGSVATRLSSVATAKCSVKGLTVCVDLTSQTMWVVSGGRTVLGPVPIRTGRAGKATPPGFYSIQDKKKWTTSSEFKDVPLPYWERFNGGMGFHQTPSYLYDQNSPGSHGCINLLRRDAIALFGLTHSGTRVHIFGAKPGT
ncbi:MAG: hypothetical protein JWO79_897 [Actinomycetia bacterium]|jgi:lipoprotein-anchoring transpeptidase ErfK/SrfK|nr:hypothetical protein [Actinomycetes bacterium]MDQ1659349.1 hypothetical protein [Cryptosporangiaceae bacterium]